MPNLSQIKRRRMLDFLETLKKEHTDDESIRALTEIENHLRDKKYGLVWEEHTEQVDEMLKENIPVFTEDVSRKITAAADAPYNFILEGDNLQSLYLLQKTHRGKVDVIYIDPPYNTGRKDFIYEDKLIDSQDGYRHSKWLSFMAERLELARSILYNSGCIFISIDENEFAQLKLLCDSIFGESNFIGCLIWRKKTGGGQTDEFFVTEHEYIMAYRKTPEFKWIEFTQKPDIKDYKYKDKLGNYKIVKLEKWGSSAHKEDRPTMYSSIIDPDGKELFPIAPDGKPGRWRVGREKLDGLINDDRVHWQKDKTNRWTPYEKVYFAEAKGKLLKSRSILYGVAETGTATKLLTNIFGKKDVFENPKPIEIIKFILKHTTGNTILDFFAGSGSTAQAVMEFNAEENAERRFILCTNNENNICTDVTYPRIKTVITGKRGDGSKYSDGIPANLKYFKCNWTPRKPEDYLLSNALCLHIREMIELQNAIEVDNVHNVLILNKADYRKYVMDDTIYSQIENIWVNQNIIFNSAEMERLNALGFKYIPREFFGQELKEAAE